MVKKPKEDILFYLLILIIIIIEAIAIYLLEKGVNNNIYAVTGILIYSLVAIIFLNILKRGRLGIGNSLWQSGAIIIISAISIFIFKEKLQFFEKIGLIFAILAVISVSLAPSE